MQVDHHDRCQLAHQPGLRLRFGCAQQQVVAIDVDAIGRHARTPRGAIGVGAREQHDVERVEHGLEASACQLARHHHQRFGTRGLVAVLLADQQHHRVAAAATEAQRLQRHTSLRTAGLEADDLRAIAAIARTRSSSHACNSSSLV